MKYLLIIVLAFTMSVSAQQKKKSGSIVVKAAKAGFGWQIGKSAGKDAYEAAKAEIKKKLAKKK